MVRWLRRQGSRRFTEARLAVPDGLESLVEEGSFAHGACGECGWRGPARRSRDQARSDAALHGVTGCALGVPVERSAGPAVPVTAEAPGDGPGREAIDVVEPVPLEENG